MVAAVAYYRMSTDKQETSVDQQRIEVEKFAKRRGFKIIREYIDEGISGDDTERRLQFQKMIRDAKTGDFELIVCWDQDRFGRFDSIDAGHWVKPLRDCGVRLSTVGQGDIDWEDFAGRMMFGIVTEGKNQFLRDLSRNVTRAIQQIAAAGYRPNGRVPYGYDRLYVDAAGNEVARVARNDASFVKRKDWRCKFAPSSSPEEVETIKWMFKTYCDLDVSMRNFAETLNERGIPSATSRRWHECTIRQMLRNRAYLGELHFGKALRGKYQNVSTSNVKKRPRVGRGKKTAKEPSEWIAIRDAHEALIDPETFDRVQVKLKQRARCGVGKSRKNSDDDVLFRGLLYCGHCGRRMHSRTTDGVKYGCQTYQPPGQPWREQDRVRRLVRSSVRLAADDSRRAGPNGFLRQRSKEPDVSHR